MSANSNNSQLFILKVIDAPPKHIRNGQKLDNLVNTFTDICGEALKSACTIRTVKAKHKTPLGTQPWRTLKESVELTLVERNTTIANLP